MFLSYLNCWHSTGSLSRKNACTGSIQGNGCWALGHCSGTVSGLKTDCLANAVWKLQVGKFTLFRHSNQSFSRDAREWPFRQVMSGYTEQSTHNAASGAGGLLQKLKTHTDSPNVAIYLPCDRNTCIQISKIMIFCFNLFKQCHPPRDLGDEILTGHFLQCFL